MGPLQMNRGEMDTKTNGSRTIASRTFGSGLGLGPKPKCLRRFAHILSPNIYSPDC